VKTWTSVNFKAFTREVFVSKVKGGGIFRRGVWGGKNGTLWEIFPELTKASQAASDHAAIWAEIDI
jgi:hypothetical protein